MFYSCPEKRSVQNIDDVVAVDIERGQHLIGPSEVKKILVNVLLACSVSPVRWQRQVLHVQVCLKSRVCLSV